MEQLEVKAAFTVDDAGTITGTAWPFGSPDSVGDVIHPGAFTVSAALPILFEHDPAAGAIGAWESAEETPEGLQVKGRLFLAGIPRAREVHSRLRSGRITGLSIGFRASETKQRPGGGRDIHALHVAEISIVANPCHPAARILTVKSAGDAATHAQKEQNMEPELKNDAGGDPIIEKKDFDALKARLDKIEAKSNRPLGANSNHAAGDNDNGELERKAFETYVRTGRLEEKALAFGTPSTGGILAPGETAKTVLEKAMEFSPVRQLASAITIAGPMISLPRLVDEVEPQSVTETGNRTEDEPSFEQIDLKPFEMAVIVPVTRILLEDAQINLEAWLSDHVARRFGKKESTWFVNGNGTTQAEGVMTSTAVGQLVAGDDVNLSADELIDLFYSIKSAYSANGSWLMNRSTMARVRKLKDADGSYLWERSFTAGQPPSLLGRPVYEAVDMPNVSANATPIIFGDFRSAYTIVDHVAFSTLRDELTGAGNGIVKLHARRRVGGRVVLGEALTKLKMAAA